MNNINGGAPDKQGFAIASLVLGIVSVVFMCIWYVSIPSAIVGLCLGISANKANKTGMATAGIVLSIIGLVITALIVILAIAGISMLGAEGLLKGY